LAAPATSSRPSPRSCTWQPSTKVRVRRFYVCLLMLLQLSTALLAADSQACRSGVSYTRACPGVAGCLLPSASCRFLPPMAA
jgi:hypothetical protein